MLESVLHENSYKKHSHALEISAGTINKSLEGCFKTLELFMDSNSCFAIILRYFLGRQAGKFWNSQP